MPRIVVLDEPNSNLDTDGENALLETIKTLKSEQITVVLVSHKTNILAVCDRILLMRDGTLQADTTPKELFKPTKAAASTAATVPAGNFQLPQNKPAAD